MTAATRVTEIARAISHLKKFCCLIFSKNVAFLIAACRSSRPPQNLIGRAVSPKCTKTVFSLAILRSLFCTRPFRCTLQYIRFPGLPGRVLSSITPLSSRTGGRRACSSCDSCLVGTKKLSIIMSTDQPITPLRKQEV